MNRFLAVILFGILVFINPSLSHAQDASDRAYKECQSRQLDEKIRLELEREKKVPSYNVMTGENSDTEKIKQENKELFEKKRLQLIEENEDDPTWFDNLGCTIANPVQTVGEYAFEDFWGDPVGKLAKAMLEGNAQFMQLVMTFWMDFDTSSREDVAANVQGVKNIVMGVAGFVLVGSFLVAGARVAASRRRGLQDGVEELGENVGRWFIFSACVPVIVPGALVASDELSKAIMEQFGATSPDVFVNMTAFEDAQIGPVVMLVLTAVAIAGSVMQLLALVVRVLMLPIAAGLTPLFAAASFTETGRSGLTHLVGYMIAAVAFKPISALLYVVVLWNVTRQGDAPQSFEVAVINALMLALAGFVAPMLVRMIVPMVSQAGGGSGAPALAAGATAAGMGAKILSPAAAGVAGVAGSAVGAAAGGALGAVGGVARGMAAGAKIMPTASSSGERAMQRVRNVSVVGAKGAVGGAMSGARRGGGVVGGAAARGGRAVMDSVSSSGQGLSRSAQGFSGALEGSLGYPGQVHR